MARAWTEEQRLAQSIRFATPPLCPSCGETNPNMFYQKNGRRSNAYCANCHKKRCNERYHSKSTIEKRASRATRYGISAEDYILLYNSQDGKCAICKKEPTGSRGLNIDHDHKTGKVRGLLCSGCNTGIGNMKEDIETLKNAISYIGG